MWQPVFYAAGVGKTTVITRRSPSCASTGEKPLACPGDNGLQEGDR